MNTKTVSNFRVFINEAQSEVITSMAEFEGQLDAQRREARALGKELREAMASLARRQDTVEDFVRGNDPGEVFAVPGRQRTAATPSRQEEAGKKPSHNDSRRKGNGSTAPETRALTRYPFARSCTPWWPTSPQPFLALNGAQHHPPGATATPCYATGFLLRRDRCSSPLSAKRRASSAWPSAPCSSRYASSEGSSALTVTSFTSPYGVEK